MTEATRLRMGILATLASSGVLVLSSAIGCGSDVAGPQSSSGATSGNGGSGTSAGSGGETSTVSGAGGAVSSSGATGGAGNAPPDCMGSRPAEACYTLDQLEVIINNPPSGGDEPPQPDGGTDGGVELTECPEAPLVHNDCCIPAIAGPFEQGDLCCYWFCEGACCGRPYLVDGAPRVASAARRADWLSPIEAAGADFVRDFEEADPSALDVARREQPVDPTTRAALAAAWLRDAQMEHASIASFARFTLELLAVGAPAELVADSQRASLDEIEHARM